MVLWWEFASCSENCRYYHGAAADLPSRTKGLQKARARTEVCMGWLRPADHNKSGQLNKGQERNSDKVGGKGKRTGKNASLLNEPTWRTRVLGGEWDLKEQCSAFVFLPKFPLLEQSFLFTEPFLHHTSVSQLLTAYKAGTLLFHVLLKGVYLEIK